MRRVRIVLALAVLAGTVSAPAATASHYCAPPLGQVCALTCRPIPIWC